MRLTIKELRSLIREEVSQTTTGNNSRQESPGNHLGQRGQKASDVAHGELAQEIVKKINLEHQNDDVEMSVNVGKNTEDLIYSIRTLDRFDIDQAEYNWELVMKKVFELLQEDYTEKLRMAASVVEQLKTSPVLGYEEDEKSTTNKVPTGMPMGTLPGKTWSDDSK